MKKHFRLKLISTLLLLLYFITDSHAQNQTDIRYMFHSALKDKAGNLWFATTGAGVYRYDAVTNEFTNLTEKDGLCYNNVSSIMEDKAGNLWFSTVYGICQYNPSEKRFTKITMKEDQCHYDINVILEDRNGNFWFGTNGWGVCRYTAGTFTNFTKEHGLGSNVIQCILEDKAGNLWLGERAGGVSRYDSSTNRFIKVNEACLSSQIMSIIEDKVGNIWFANLYHGLCRYDPSTGSGHRPSTSSEQVPVSDTFTHLTEENGLCHNFITCIYEDSKGNLWFGSDTGDLGKEEGGLCRYDPSASLRAGGKSFTHFTSKDGLRNTKVWSVVEDNEGSIWVCTKGGLYRYHSPSGKFIDYTFKVNNN